MGIVSIIKYDRANPGHMAMAEKMLLYALVRHTRPHHVVEIGVSRGHSLCWIAQALRDNGFGKVTGIDNWTMQHGGGAGGPHPVQARLKELKLTNVANIVTSDSKAWLAKAPNNSAEIVWVDGAHDYESALADIHGALRVASALVLVHDSRNLPGVYLACRHIGGGVWLPGFRGMWLRNAGGPWEPVEETDAEGKPANDS